MNSAAVICNNVTMKEKAWSACVVDVCGSECRCHLLLFNFIILDKACVGGGDAGNRRYGDNWITVYSGSIVVDLISSIDKSAVTLWTRTSEINA